LALSRSNRSAAVSVERAAVSGSNTSQNQIGILALLCKNGSAAISAEYVAVRGSNISRKKTHLGALTQQRKRGRQCLACGCPWQQYKSEKNRTLALLGNNGSAAASAEHVAVRGSNIRYKSEKNAPWRSHATTEARPSVLSMWLSVAAI